jgi:RHS repeat-associated protein
MNAILSRVSLLKNISCLVLLNGFVQAQNIPANNAYPIGTVTPVLPANFTAGIKVNYLRTTLLTQPVSVEANIQPTDYSQTRVKTIYFDGLGKVLQTVDHFASVYANDVVNVVKYDNLGRDAWHFLPYAKAEGLATDNGKFKLTAYSDQKDFYKNTPGFEEDNYFYIQSNYEPSPLNRVIKSLPQGSSWVGSNRGTTVTEYPLQASSGLRIFTIGYTPGSMPVTSGTYAAADLKVKVVTDEDGNFTQEYTTKDNLVVIKNVGKTGSSQTIMTYYVYDDFGLLRFVIPPKALVWLVNNNWTMTPAIASELCFNYEYDGRLRKIVSKTPGAGTQYLIYNNRDELILTQTSTQAAKGEWLFNKYDALGRLIQTGVYNNTATHASLQALVNANTPGSDAFLAYLFNTTIYGNAAYVTTFTTAKVLTTNYYDDYSFTTRTYDANYMNGLPAGWNTVVSKETTNLLTGTKVVVLDGAVTATELISVHFYNDRGLLLQTQAQNHKGGWNYATTSYDFSGQKLGTYTEVNNPAAANNTKIKTVETFSYDHAGRLTGATHNINDLNLQVSPSNYNYDELGRLANKNFSNGMVPSVEFDYNIRGWITGINKNYCLYASTDQTFGMEINYDYGYSTNYFNGNIAGIKWRNSGKYREQRSYGFIYDAYNRLKSGDFVMEYNTGSTIIPWSSASKDFSASNILYDENGNITSMKHMGLNVAGQKIILDDLSYGYTTNSNKLASVSESASSQSKNPTTYDKLGDFRDVAGTTDYTYDPNGNVLTDANKSLSFTYDELVNKTKKVSKGAQSVNYLYDANGTKLQKKVTGGAATVTTDYINSAVYIDNSLSFVNHSEGRIRYVPTATNKYLYDYYIKDHLGSTRSVVCYSEGAITSLAKTTSSPTPNEVKYIATSEPELAAKENQLFDNVDITRSAKPINKTATDNYVAKISSTNSKTIIGPDITLKVMAGDTIKISAEALYIPEKTSTTAIAEDVIKNFITAFTTLPSMAAEGMSTIANSNTKDLANAVLNMQKKNAAIDGPRAFLNYILYDEYMNMVPEGSGALQVKNKDGWQTLETDRITIPQNGFLRVFSNNMEAAPVSINNTTLSAIPGVLVEEYNYYPYGLVFGASSAAATIKKTDYLYNGKELQHNEFGDGNGLELEDYGARLYDPQIGRWHVPDPLVVIAPNKTPYNFVSNNPLNRVDPRGLTDYQVNGKTRTINDGHNDVSMKVSERQFNRLQNKFDKGGSGYERMMNGLSIKNGYTTSSAYADSWASSGVGISVTNHQAGGDSYGQWSIQNNHQTYGIVEHVARVADAGLGSVTDQFANINLGSNGVTYFRQNSGAIFRGNQYVRVTSAASRYSGLVKGAKIGGIAAGVLLGGYEVYQGYQQDGGHYGYNAQVQTAGAVGGLVGGLAGAKVGSATGAAVGAWFGGVGAVPGAIIGGLIGGGIGAWGGDYYGEQAAKAVIK